MVASRDRSQNLAFQLVEHQLGRMANGLARSVGRRLDQRAEFLEHVVGRFDQFRPIANQSMTTVRHAAVDPSRHGKNIAPLLGGMAGRDQRRRLDRSLDHDHAQ